MGGRLRRSVSLPQKDILKDVGGGVGASNQNGSSQDSPPEYTLTQ